MQRRVARAITLSSPGMPGSALRRASEVCCLNNTSRETTDGAFTLQQTALGSLPSPHSRGAEAKGRGGPRAGRAGARRTRPRRARVRGAGGVRRAAGGPTGYRGVRWLTRGPPGQPRRPPRAIAAWGGGGGLARSARARAQVRDRQRETSSPCGRVAVLSGGGSSRRPSVGRFEADSLSDGRA
jgi:hypothetical protein